MLFLRSSCRNKKAILEKSDTDLTFELLLWMYFYALFVSSTIQIQLRMEGTLTQGIWFFLGM
jgi:hypothetical protein